MNELVRRINSCTRCILSKTRNKAVPGKGSLTADIMFIGEGPGLNEDKTGDPFVGQAGRILDEMLASINLKRGDVFITNMVKCRPPKNRDPLVEELEACKDYLDAQIELIAPKVIVCLGRFSFGKFFPDEKIGQARGKPREWKGILIYPIYHPAYALYNPGSRVRMDRDFLKLPGLIEKALTLKEVDEVEEDGPIQQTFFS